MTEPHADIAWERWVASRKGTVAHLWHADQLHGSGLCGQGLHRDAFPAREDVPTCKRCLAHFDG